MLIASYKVTVFFLQFKRGMPQEKSSASYFLRVFGNEMFYSSNQLEKSVAEEIAKSSEIRSIMSQIAQVIKS